MTEQAATRGRGRPNLFGKNNENAGVIAASIINRDTLTPYYLQKLMDMGYLEIKVSEKGEEFIKHHAK